jgi:hypothetical protein
VNAYGSYGYDFKVELAAAKKRQVARNQEKAARAREAELALQRTFWLSQFPDAPTPEALRRHGERLGWEGVQEVADAYSVDLTATTKTNRGRGRATGTRGLKQIDKLLSEDDLKGSA